MAKCCCGTIMTVLSNGYTICETCRDAREDMRLERDTLKAENAQMRELLKDVYLNVVMPFGLEDAVRRLLASQALKGGK